MELSDFYGYGCFTLRAGELSAEVMEYGASLRSLRCSERELALHYDTLEQYERSGACVGAVVGRYANRIGGAAFTLGGKRYALDDNDGANTLHGGAQGKPWHKRAWMSEILNEQSVAFTLRSPAGDNGFPGALEARVVYTLSERGLRMDFYGRSDADTVFAPSSHAYFTLGTPTVLETTLQINAETHLEMGEGLIPTGRVLPCEGDFDFSVPKAIGRDYDDCFVLASEHACTASANGLSLSLYTDYPALQFYTGKYLDCGYAPNAGFAIEPEFYPDSPNKPDFLSPVLKAGEEYHKYLEFHVAKL